MKTLVINHKGKNLVVKVSDEDYDRVSQFTWCWGGRYVRRRLRVAEAQTYPGQKFVSLHRFILNAPPGVEVDHQRADPLDCTRENLRLATSAQNKQNETPGTRTRYGIRKTSRYKGVYWAPKLKRWVAQVGHTNLGPFLAESGAAWVYDQEARERFGRFANTNFKSEREFRKALSAELCFT